MYIVYQRWNQRNPIHFITTLKMPTAATSMIGGRANV
jgi:hypothetical protein